MKKPRKRPSKKGLPYKSSEIDAIILRISECDSVVNELDNSNVWRILCKDMQAEREKLDNTWQEIIDPVKLQEARVLKFAIMHILQLRNKYQEELDSQKEELRKLQSVETEMIKDYDLETKVEADDE